MTKLEVREAEALLELAKRPDPGAWLDERREKLSMTRDELFFEMRRRGRNIGSVAVVDVLLGWTIVGWAVALAMAVRSK